MREKNTVFNYFQICATMLVVFVFAIMAAAIPTVISANAAISKVTNKTNAYTANLDSDAYANAQDSFVSWTYANNYCNGYPIQMIKPATINGHTTYSKIDSYWTMYNNGWIYCPYTGRDNTLGGQFGRVNNYGAGLDMGAIYWSDGAITGTYTSSKFQTNINASDFIGVRYPHVFQTGGEWVDLVISVVEMTNLGYGGTYSGSGAGVYFSNAELGLSILGIESAKLQFTYVYAGTKTKIGNIPNMVTFADVDMEYLIYNTIPDEVYLSEAKTISGVTDQTRLTTETAASPLQLQANYALTLNYEPSSNESMYWYGAVLKYSVSQFQLTYGSKYIPKSYRIYSFVELPGITGRDRNDPIIPGGLTSKQIKGTICTYFYDTTASSINDANPTTNSSLLSSEVITGPVLDRKLISTATADLSKITDNTDSSTLYTIPDSIKNLINSGEYTVVGTIVTDYKNKSVRSTSTSRTLSFAMPEDKRVAHIAYYLKKTGKTSDLVVQSAEIANGSSKTNATILSNYNQASFKLSQGGTKSLSYSSSNYTPGGTSAYSYAYLGYDIIIENKDNAADKTVVATSNPSAGTARSAETTATRIQYDQLYKNSKVYVRFYYQKLYTGTITTRYVCKDTGTEQSVATSTTNSYTFFGDRTEVLSAKTFAAHRYAGYEGSGVSPTSGTSTSVTAKLTPTNRAITVTFLYEKERTGTTNVYFVDETGNTFATAYYSELFYGKQSSSKTYSYSSIASEKGITLKDYKFVGSAKVKGGSSSSFSTNGVTSYTYYYTVNETSFALYFYFQGRYAYEITVNSIDETSGSVLDTYVIGPTEFYGAVSGVAVSAKEIEDYTYSKYICGSATGPESTVTLSFNKSTTTATIDFYYRQNMSTGVIHIRYLNRAGNEIYPGKDISVTFADKDGYASSFTAAEIDNYEHAYTETPYTFENAYNLTMTNNTSLAMSYSGGNLALASLNTADDAQVFNLTRLSDNTHYIQLLDGRYLYSDFDGNGNANVYLSNTNSSSRAFKWIIVPRSSGYYIRNYNTGATLMGSGSSITVSTSGSAITSSNALWTPLGLTGANDNCRVSNDTVFTGLNKYNLEAYVSFYYDRYINGTITIHYIDIDTGEEIHTEATYPRFLDSEAPHTEEVTAKTIDDYYWIKSEVEDAIRPTPTPAERTVTVSIDETVYVADVYAYYRAVGLSANAILTSEFITTHNDYEGVTDYDSASTSAMEAQQITKMKSGYGYFAYVDIDILDKDLIRTDLADHLGGHLTDPTDPVLGFTPGNTSYTGLRVVAKYPIDRFGAIDTVELEPIATKINTATGKFSTLFAFTAAKDPKAPSRTATDAVSYYGYRKKYIPVDFPDNTDLVVTFDVYVGERFYGSITKKFQVNDAMYSDDYT